MITNQIDFFQYLSHLWFFHAGNQKTVSLLFPTSVWPVQLDIFWHKWENGNNTLLHWTKTFIWFSLRVSKYQFSSFPQKLSLPGRLYFLVTNIAVMKMYLSSILLHIWNRNPSFNMNLPTAMPRGFAWNFYMLLWRDVIKFLEITQYQTVGLVSGKKFQTKA